MPAAPQLDRLDRYVRRSSWKMPAGASRHRLTYSLEEALRLAGLPAEEEGRIYCFRRVTLTGIPVDASRAAWLEKVQQALSALAAQAVHAADVGSEAAVSVFFHNREEALEVLLAAALRQTARLPWFATQVLGVKPEAGRAALVQAVLEHLRELPAGAGAAAPLILAAVEITGPAPLLVAVPPQMTREWLRVLDGPRTVATAETAPALLPEQLRQILIRAAQCCGWRDPRTVWLAALATIAVSPSTAVSGTAVRIARVTLRALEAESPANRLGRSAEARVSPRARDIDRVFFEGEQETLPESVPPGHALPLPEGVQPRGPIAPAVACTASPASRPSVEAEPRPSHAPSAQPTALPAWPEQQPECVSPAPASPIDPHPALIGTPSARPPRPGVLGERTFGAGLYFLLNALRRLGIAQALESSPALREADFPLHVLRRLAARARVAPDDPILLCLRTEPAEFRRPANVDLVRIWELAVRRWCWRNGKLTLPEIVLRPGRVWLTRTDLDVTMPLDSTDIRIRRIGLDIDPGWLPWFGPFGKVVRFHYRSRHPEAAC